MIIEHEACSGIGYEVVASDDLKDSEALEGGLYEYVFMEHYPEFKYFQTGNAFTGIMTGTYLCIKDPFKLGLDLSGVKEKLDFEIKRLGLETVGDFGVVGGLHTY